MFHVIKILSHCTLIAALAAIGVSSASASFTLTATKCEGKGIATLCYSTTEKAASGLFEFSGEEELKVKDESNDAARVPALGLVMLSSALTSEGAVAHQTEPLVTRYFFKGKFVFDKAVMDEPSTCKLPSESIVTETLVAIPNATSTEVTIEPELGSSGSFTTITLEGAECPATLVGTNKIKGTQKCLVPGSAEDLKVHLLACRASGSALKFAGSALTFEGTTESELTDDTTDFWSGQEA